MKIKSISSHRNGCRGTAFHVVLFTIKEGLKNHNMVATVFPESGNVAVLDADETHSGNIEFGMGNSWRGDTYESELRQAISAKYGETWEAI